MANTSSMKVQTPRTPEDHQQASAAVVNSEAEIADFVSGAIPVDDKPEEFNTAAARVLMKIMYAARMARPGLIRTMSHLARFLTTLTDGVGIRLHKPAHLTQ